MKRPQLIGLVALALVLLLAGMVAGVQLDRYVLNQIAFSGNESAQFGLIKEAWDLTRHVYVDRTATEPTRLAYGSIAGMIDSLGDTGHSTFLTPDEVRRSQNYERGQLEGVGIEVQEKDGQVVVVAPIDNSPAQKAGIGAGDVILAVDGKPALGLADAVSRILGPAGTSVTLTIHSASGQTREVPLVRARIDIKSVSWNKVPGTTIAHIRIAALSSGTTDELIAALKAIRQQSSTAIILDLRNNPGGLLDEAVSSASQFLKDGNVLLEKSADNVTRSVPVKPGGLETVAPMVVLINQGSASGAEIIAGALQDAGRAKLVGQTTFGTGTVLAQYTLSDGSAVLLATEEWLTPSGRTIWHKGLTPDIVVALPAGTTPVSPVIEASMTREQLDKSGDAQLLKAISLLGG